MLNIYLITHVIRYTVLYKGDWTFNETKMRTPLNLELLKSNIWAFLLQNMVKARLLGSVNVKISQCSEETEEKQNKAVVYNVYLQWKWMGLIFSL